MMFRVLKNIDFNSILVAISIAACIPSIALAADAPATTPSTDNSKLVTTPAPKATTPSTPETTNTTNPTKSTNIKGSDVTTPKVSDVSTTTTPTTNSTPNQSPTTNLTPTTEKIPNTPTNSAPEAPQAEIKVTPAEKQKAIVDFLKRAGEYIKDNGKESSLSEFNKQNGIFTKDSLYVFAISYDGAILATQDSDQKILGTNQLNFKDPDNINVIQKLIEKAKSGGGWLLYKSTNPATKTLECKNTYVMPGNISGNSDYLIGTGYYYPISEKTKKCESEK